MQRNPAAEGQVDAIKARRPPGIRTGIPVDTQKKRRRAVEEMQRTGAFDVPNLIDDTLSLAGTVMYWAEGSKTKRGLEIVNTDPRAMELFIAWVRAFHDENATSSFRFIYTRAMTNVQHWAIGEKRSGFRRHDSPRHSSNLPELDIAKTNMRTVSAEFG